MRGSLPQAWQALGYSQNRARQCSAWPPEGLPAGRLHGGQPWQWCIPRAPATRGRRAGPRCGSRAHPKQEGFSAHGSPLDCYGWGREGTCSWTAACWCAACQAQRSSVLAVASSRLLCDRSMSPCSLRSRRPCSRGSPRCAACAAAAGGGLLAHAGWLGQQGQPPLCRVRCCSRRWAAGTCWLAGAAQRSALGPCVGRQQGPEGRPARWC